MHICKKKNIEIIFFTNTNNYIFVSLLITNTNAKILALTRKAKYEYKNIEAKKG